jgi:hypothetical protein
VYISRDVVFDDYIFPFSALPPPTDTSISSEHTSPILPDQFVDAAHSPICCLTKNSPTPHLYRPNLLSAGPFVERML